MKIIILFLAVISLTFVASNQMCRQTEIKVYSSIQPVAQSFTLDVKKIKGIEFQVSENEFKGANLVPLEQVGFVLEKTASSKVLDAVHHQYLRNEPDSVWMPYAYTGDWTRNGYVITNQMKRTSASKTVRPLVSFEFVNDFDLMSITSDDMNKFLTNLRYNSEKRKLIKQTVKNAILAAADSYTTSTDALKKMKKDNKNTKQEITEYKAKLTTTVTEITTLTTKITTLETTEATKSAELQVINDKIDDIIAQLAILNKQLKKEEKDLLATRPTDISQIQSNLNVQLKAMQYPQRAPERFLEEYSIAAGNGAEIVQANYRDCLPQENKVMPCSTANMKSSKVKKLRRSFF
jgi:predicted  nucleic acid-binding Zn-ribbon protein